MGLKIRRKQQGVAEDSAFRLLLPAARSRLATTFDSIWNQVIL
jgi:hypothetical protein